MRHLFDPIRATVNVCDSKCTLKRPPNSLAWFNSFYENRPFLISVSRKKIKKIYPEWPNSEPASQ